MSLRHSSGKPDRAFTRKWIFESEDFGEVAFIVGVAHRKGVLEEPLIRRWRTFLLYYMPEIYETDRFTSAQYRNICDFIKDMQQFAKHYKDAAPHHIQEAEEKAPREIWTSPKSFKE